MNFLNRLKKNAIRHPWLHMTLVILILFFISVLLIYHYEKKFDPNLTFSDAFRIVLVFSMGEYGETPVSYIGRVMSLLLFVFGMFVGAAIIGKFASIFVSLKMRERMPKGLKQHIVMCNWNENSDRIIREIHAPQALPDVEIVVITQNEVNEEELKLDSRYDEVYFVRHDPTLHDVLKKTNAHYARSVIIVADHECSDPDAKTALISLAITKLERDLADKPHIVAEVVNSRKAQHLLDAGVDEWICSSNFGLGIIAQCAINKKISEVYQELLTYSKETNEIYLVPDENYPDTFIGRKFEEVADILTLNRDDDNPSILLGIKRDDRVILNPKDDEMGILEKGDHLVVVSFDQPDLNYIKI